MDVEAFAAIGGLLVGIAGVLVGLSGLRVATKGVESANEMAKLADRQTVASESSTDLERRRQMGCLPIVTFKAGYSVPPGSRPFDPGRYLVLGFADASENRGWEVEVIRITISAPNSEEIVPVNPWPRLPVQDNQWTTRMNPPGGGQNILGPVSSDEHLGVLIPESAFLALLEEGPDSPVTTNLKHIPEATVNIEVSDPIEHRVFSFPLGPFPYGPANAVRPDTSN